MSAYDSDRDRSPEEREPAPIAWEAVVAAALMLLITLVVTGYVVRDPARRRRVLNRAGRTWLQMEDTAWRTTRPLRRRQKALEEEVQRIVKELWDRVDDLTVPAQAVQDIRLEVRRGATTISVNWPAQAAGECALWIRELLR